jgi:hypothetical protein
VAVVSTVAWDTDARLGMSVYFKALAIAVPVAGRPSGTVCFAPLTHEVVTREVADILDDAGSGVLQIHKARGQR